MIKIFNHPRGPITGQDFRMFDLRNPVDFNSSGLVIIADPNGTRAAAYNTGDRVTVETGAMVQGGALTETMFTGIISDIDKEDNIRIKLHGLGSILQQTTFRRSYNRVDAARIFRDMLDGTGINYELGRVTTRRAHTHVAPNGTILKEMHRVNMAFNLGLAPYIDRRGTLHLKTIDEAVKDTGATYTTENIIDFKNDILRVPIDEEIDVYNIITVLGQRYITTEHRAVHNDHTTYSALAVTKI